MPSQSSKISYEFGSITANDINVNSGSVSQATSITTAVNLTAPFGIITTQSATAAADSTHTFTANHPSVTTSKVVHATIVGYAGTGLPSVRVSTASGSFSVIIQNHHSSAALNAPLKIAYSIF